MGFDDLRPMLAKYGLSEVGTLGELSARVTSTLEGRVKATAEGGGLSKFGEKAARMIFRAADKVLCEAVIAITGCTDTEATKCDGLHLFDFIFG